MSIIYNSSLSYVHGLTSGATIENETCYHIKSTCRTRLLAYVHLALWVMYQERRGWSTVTNCEKKRHTILPFRKHQRIINDDAALCAKATNYSHIIKSINTRWFSWHRLYVPLLNQMFSSGEFPGVLFLIWFAAATPHRSAVGGEISHMWAQRHKTYTALETCSSSHCWDWSSAALHHSSVNSTELWGASAARSSLTAPSCDSCIHLPWICRIFISVSLPGVPWHVYTASSACSQSINSWRVVDVCCPKDAPRARAACILVTPWSTKNSQSEARYAAAAIAMSSSVRWAGEAERK